MDNEPITVNGGVDANQHQVAVAIGYFCVGLGILCKAGEWDDVAAISQILARLQLRNNLKPEDTVRIDEGVM
jgi:hypothetical protein